MHCPCQTPTLARKGDDLRGRLCVFGWSDILVSFKSTRMQSMISLMAQQLLVSVSRNQEH